MRRIVIPLVLLAALGVGCSDSAPGASTASSSAGSTGGAGTHGSTTGGAGASTGSGGTSGSGGATTGASGGAVVINEIVAKGDNWVELYNPASSAADLTDYAVTDSEDGGPKLSSAVVFPAGTSVPAHGFLLVVGVSDGGSGGPYTGCLGGAADCFTGGFGISNSHGETLFLLDPHGAVAQSAAYPAHGADIDGLSWARLPDGAGAFALGDATPGAANRAHASAGGAVVINEICAKGGNWVELYNPGTGPADLSGYVVTDTEDGGPKLPGAVVFPAGTSVPAGGFVVVVGASDGGSGGPFADCLGSAAPCFTGDFGISNSRGETLFLLDPQGGIAQASDYPAHAADTEGLSWGRLPDGTGGFAINQATPGTPNQAQ